MVFGFAKRPGMRRSPTVVPVFNKDRGKSKIEYNACRDGAFMLKWCCAGQSVFVLIHVSLREGFI